MGRESGKFEINVDHQEEGKMSHWEEFMEATHARFDRTIIEPTTIEISYFATLEDQHATREVVFEDPVDYSDRPRLLVSLRSVLALKNLCERELNRASQLSAVLCSCRTAYFKELIWLREQLTLATRPNAQPVIDYVNAYEVYWYDPPAYVDEALSEFMLECIRITNKRLIEENYDLMVKLGMKNPTRPENDVDAQIRTIVKQIGSGKAVRKMAAFVHSKQGSKEMAADFDLAIEELAPKKESGPKVQEMDPNVLRELEALKHSSKEADGVRKKLQDRVDEAEAKAFAELQRADDLARRLAEMEKKAGDPSKEVADLQGQKQELEKELHMLFKNIPNFAQRFGVLAAELSKGSRPGPKDYPEVKTAVDAVSLLQKAVSSMEAAVAGAGKVPEDSRVKELEDELRRHKQAAEAEKRAREAREKAMNASKSGKESDLLSQYEALRTEKEKVDEDLKNALKREADLLAQLELLRLQMDKMSGELDEARKGSKAGDDALRQALEEAQALNEELVQKVARQAQKIKELKEEVKKWKRAAGETVEDESDDDDSAYDGDIPKFMLKYSKRIRGSLKPRWLLLNEDALYHNQKRDFLFDQRKQLAYQHGEEANAAFSFLHGGESAHASLQLSTLSQPHRNRSHSPPSHNEVATLYSVDSAAAAVATHAMDGQALQVQQLLPDWFDSQKTKASPQEAAPATQLQVVPSSLSHVSLPQETVPPAPMSRAAVAQASSALADAVAGARAQLASVSQGEILPIKETSSRSPSPIQSRQPVAFEPAMLSKRNRSSASRKPQGACGELSQGLADLDISSLEHPLLASVHVTSPQKTPQIVHATSPQKMPQMGNEPPSPVQAPKGWSTEPLPNSQQASVHDANNVSSSEDKSSVAHINKTEGALCRAAAGLAPIESSAPRTVSPVQEELHIAGQSRVLLESPKRSEHISKIDIPSASASLSSGLHHQHLERAMTAPPSASHHSSPNPKVATGASDELRHGITLAELVATEKFDAVSPSKSLSKKDTSTIVGKPATAKVNRHSMSTTSSTAWQTEDSVGSLRGGLSTSDTGHTVSTGGLSSGTGSRSASTAPVGRRPTATDTTRTSPSAAFDPPLGFATMGQAMTEEGDWRAMSTGFSPSKQKRLITTPGIRDMVAPVNVISRSTGSLPLTNSRSPCKRRKGSTFEDVDILSAEVLPPLPPGRVRKGPASPQWLMTK